MLKTKIERFLLTGVASHLYGAHAPGTSRIVGFFPDENVSDLFSFFNAFFYHFYLILSIFGIN